MQLIVSRTFGKGSSGDLFQIDALQDVGTGRVLTVPDLDVGRHFIDRQDVAEHLRDIYGREVNFDFEDEVWQD